MQKSALLAAIQQEMKRHDFSHFVENPPTIAEGGKGVVASGFPACRKRINSMSQFLDHLAYDVMPAPLVTNSQSALNFGCSRAYQDSQSVILAFEWVDNQIATGQSARLDQSRKEVI